MDDAKTSDCTHSGLYFRASGRYAGRDGIGLTEGRYRADGQEAFLRTVFPYVYARAFLFRSRTV